MFGNKLEEYKELNLNIDKILTRVDGIHKFYVSIITALIGIITAAIACKLSDYTLYKVINYVLILCAATCIMWYKHLFTSYLDIYNLTDVYSAFTNKNKYIPIYKLDSYTNNLRVNSYLPKTIALIITIILCRFFIMPDCILSINPIIDSIIQIILYCFLFIEGFYSPVYITFNKIKYYVKYKFNGGKNAK